MLKRNSGWLLTILVAAAAIGMMVFSASGAQSKDTASSGLPYYLVISPHTPDECVATLDQVQAMSKGALDRWYWGCMSGDHTGYQIVQAASENDALQIVPANLRAKAHVMKLNKFTAQEVAAFHQMKH